MIIILKKITAKINELKFSKIYNHIWIENKLMQAHQGKYAKQAYSLGKVFSVMSFILFIGFFNEIRAQEGCEAYGLILNENKGSIENVLIISFDSTEYEMENKLAVIEDIRTAYLAKPNSLNTHSIGFTKAKGEFLFIMGSSKYAIIYHPDFHLKVIDRSKLETPCKFDLITLKKKE